jgi:RecB family exonuclease
MTTAAAVQTLTHSRLSCFRACPRKHYIRYELGIRPQEDEFHLRVGTGFHAALDAADKGQDVEAVLEAALSNEYDLALVAAMVTGHRNRWDGEPVEVVASELPFEMPLRNPETGAATPLFTLAGVVDRIVRLGDGRLALMEYKTTSRDFAPGADYWTALHRDQQLSIYVHGARHLGYDISTILYDVTRRPAQRPSAVPLRDAEGFKIVHDRGGQRVRTADGKKWRETADNEKGYVLQTRVETAEEFAKRVSEAIAADPFRHFARIEIARLEDDLTACSAGLWQQMQTLRAMQRSGGWYANPASCITSYGSCAYAGICDRKDLATATPEGFARADDIHPELRRGEAEDAG